MCDPPSLEIQHQLRGMVWLLEVYVLVNFKDYQVTLILDVLGNSILKQCAKQD